MPLYTPENTDGHCQVHVVETLDRLIEVKSIDTDTGEVVTFGYPWELTPDGLSLATATLKFRSIYPIFGGGRLPCLFHCYGRLDDIPMTECSP